MPADNIVESRHSTSPSARPQEFDVGLAFNHWKRDGRPERLEFSFPGLIVLYSFLGFNLQDESIFRTSHAVKPGKDVTSHRMPHPSLSYPLDQAFGI